MSRNTASESICGTLMRIRYQKDNGWGVFTVRCRAEGGYTTEVSASGVLPSPVAGQDYTFEGNFVEHPQYGREFKFKSASVASKETVARHETAEGAVALLSSSRFPGVGPKRAMAIVARFGSKTLDIIRNDHMRLTEVPGIGKLQAENIYKCMPNQDVWSELRMLLHSLTETAITKIYEKYGDKAVKLLKADPYRLINDLDGYGFTRADVVARDVGITGAHPMRVRAAIYHCLEQASDSGHCFSFAPNLQVLVEDLIPGVSVENIADGIKSLLGDSNGKMRLHVDDDGAVYLYRLWNAETNAAKVVREMCARPVDPTYTPAMVEDAASSILAETGIELEETQKDAVYNSLRYPFCVITGGPGTGKTTIIRTILKVLQNTPLRRAPRVALMAPTGRASRRMAEATNDENARTIHSHLFLGKEDSSRYYTRYNPFPYDYIIVDESSMIDIVLASKLLSAIDPQKSHIIFIGDADQLPPVGPGTFFLDLIKSIKVPTSRLKFSFRQSGSIAQNANKINTGMGVHSFVEDDQFQFVKATKDDAAAIGIRAYTSMVKKFGINDVVLLSPKKAGTSGTVNLNKTIQAMLNPVDESNCIKTYDYLLGAGDRVMLTKNNVVDEHANGDVGTIEEIAYDTVTILFDNGDRAKVTKSKVTNNFILAYASTIHKSQGSEYAGVVLLFTSEHSFMGERALVYTGETRAKQMCYLIGDARAINRAISTVKPIERNSKLRDRINA